MDLLEVRGEPYIWISWLAKYIAGETQCGYQPWLKTHYAFEKLPSAFDSISYRIQHVSLLRRRCERLRAEGWALSIEDQNKFKLKGRLFNGSLSGKPDIIALREGAASIEDCKTGRPKDSDVVQVQLYMYLMPIAWPQTFAATSPAGRVIYANTAREIPADSITPDLKDAVKAGLLRFMQDEELPKVPSANECRFCDVPATICAERVTGDQDVCVETDLF